MKRLSRILAALLLLGSACFASDTKPGWSNRFPFGGVNVETISATTTLASGTSKPVNRYTVSGSDRNVVLPSESNSMGLYYWIGNVGASNNAVVKASNGSTTVVTVTPGYWGYVHCDGTTWYGSIIPTGSITALTVTTLTATTGNFTDIDAGASGTAGTVDVFPTTAGKGKLTLSATNNTGDTQTIITNAAMGQAETVSIPDSVAATDTFAMLGVANAFTKRQTTTDGIASGTARVIGGRCTSQSATGTALTNSASETVLGSYTIPANTLGAGSTLHVRALVAVTANNGATTLTVRLRLGPTTLTGTALVSSAATDTAANDICLIDYRLNSLAAAGASVSCRGSGFWQEPGAAGGAFKTAVLGTAGAGSAFATNGALLCEVTGQWNAADSNSCQLEQLIVRIE